MHDEATWPIHGHYQCRKCRRVYSVPLRMQWCNNGPCSSLNPTVVAGRVPWPDLARLAAKVGFPGVDLDLPAAMQQGLPATRGAIR